MFEFLVYDGKKRIKGELFLSILLSALALVVIWVWPSFSAEFDDDEFLEIYPDELLRLFDVQTMTSLEGFLAFEFYAFGWIILLGLYFAYTGAGLIADDVDRGRMDAILAMPVSRIRVLAERFGALGVPIILVNSLVPPVILIGAWLVDESLSIADIFAVHLLSIPYLFACAGIGLVFSVVFDRVSIAQRVSLGVTFGMFLLESLLEDTALEFVGTLTPMRYYDPNGVLLDSDYDLVAVAMLVAMTLLLVGVSGAWFARKDI